LQNLDYDDCYLVCLFFYRWHSMKTFCLKCLSWPKTIIAHHRYKEWIESTMAMFGPRWSQPISRIILAWILGRFTAWVIYIVCMTIWLLLLFRWSQRDYLEWKIGPHFGQRVDSVRSFFFLV
jgi:hypothetical protein